MTAQQQSFEIARVASDEYAPTLDANGLPIEGKKSDSYAICVPYWGAIDIEHQDCMNGLRDRFDRYRVIGMPYIDQARAMLCRAAEDHRGVFFVDHDIVFDPDDVDRVIEAAEQHQTVVSGVYAERSAGKLRLVGAFREELSEALFFAEGGLYPGYYAGLGFTAIPRCVLEAVGKDMPRVQLRNMDWVKPLFAHNTAGGWYSGEDISFYDRVQKAGFQMLLDTRPRLYHVGRYRYGVEDCQIVVPRYDSLRLTLRQAHVPVAPVVDAATTELNQGELLKQRLDAFDADTAKRLEPLPPPLDVDDHRFGVVNVGGRVGRLSEQQGERRAELGAGVWAIVVPPEARGAWYDWLSSPHGERVDVVGTEPGDVVLLQVMEAVPFGLALVVYMRANPSAEPIDVRRLEPRLAYRVRVHDELAFANWVTAQAFGVFETLDVVELESGVDGWEIVLTAPVELDAAIAEATSIGIVVPPAAGAEAVAEAMIAASETPVAAIDMNPALEQLEQTGRVVFPVGDFDVSPTEPGLLVPRPIESAEPPPLELGDAPPPESGFPALEQQQAESLG